MVENPAEADILWLQSHFKDYLGLSQSSPGVLINQFPFENVITIKDLLCVVCHRAGKGGSGPDWLPTTYNLNTELDKFVSYFQQREKAGEDNH